MYGFIYLFMHQFMGKFDHGISLCASLSVKNPYLPFRTLDEALSDLDWQIGILKGTAMVAIINVSSYRSLPYYAVIIILLYKSKLSTLRRVVSDKFLMTFDHVI